jgi:divalent metal cation (Fe/Co/Zn/Cd) transporter
MDPGRDSCCDAAGSTLAPERAALTRQAIRLEWLGVAWMTVEGAVAIGAGVAAGSLTLTAFGLDSVIELASACVLIWRINVELRHGQAISGRAERIASKTGGGLLFALAAYIIVGAVWSLWTRHTARRFPFRASSLHCWPSPS